MHGAGFSRCVTLAFMPHSPRITFRADLHRRSCLTFSKSRPGKTPKRPKQDGNQEPRETDVTNAGAKWEDSEVVVDQGVITSRNPGDLEAFSAKIIEEVKEGLHKQRSAA